jgi:hypothetical protein
VPLSNTASRVRQLAGDTKSRDLVAGLPRLRFDTLAYVDKMRKTEGAKPNVSTFAQLTSSRVSCSESECLEVWTLKRVSYFWIRTQGKSGSKDNCQVVYTPLLMHRFFL